LKDDDNEDDDATRGSKQVVNIQGSYKVLPPPATSHPHQNTYAIIPTSTCPYIFTCLYSYQLLKMTLCNGIT